MSRAVIPVPGVVCEVLQRGAEVLMDDGRLLMKVTEILDGGVCAAAVILPEGKIIEGVNDSKKLTEKKREALFDVIKAEAAAYAVAFATVREIEELNILNATMLAMKRAVEALPVKADFAMIDGNRLPGLSIDCEAIVKGDARSMSIACASILAKVSRDRLLYEYAKEHFSVEATGERQLEIYRIIRRRESQRRGTRDGVVICGAYGFGNAGDEAILQAIVDEMRALDKNMPVTVLSRQPRETRMTCGVNAYHSFDLFHMGRVMKGSKLYINGGGNLMQDVTSRYSLWYYLYTIRRAKKLGCAVQMYGCGIGPILYPRDQKLVAKTLNQCVDAITLREPDSRKVLERFGVTEPEILLSSDPALTLPPEPQARVQRFLAGCGIPADGKYIAFVLRRWRGFEEKSTVFAAAAVYAYLNYGLTPVFLCINHRTDWEAAKLVAQHLSIPYHVIAQPLSSGMTIGVLAKMKAVVSMRLHGLVFAAGQGVPLAGVSYDPKVTAFLDYIEQDNYQELENLTVENASTLIDCAIQLGKEGGELRRRTELLNEKESINREAAHRLLERSASV